MVFALGCILSLHPDGSDADILFVRPEALSPNRLFGIEPPMDLGEVIIPANACVAEESDLEIQGMRTVAIKGRIVGRFFAESDRAPLIGDRRGRGWGSDGFVFQCVKFVGGAPVWAEEEDIFAIAAGLQAVHLNEVDSVDDFRVLLSNRDEILAAWQNLSIEETLPGKDPFNQYFLAAIGFPGTELQYGELPKVASNLPELREGSFVRAMLDGTSPGFPSMKGGTVVENILDGAAIDYLRQGGMYSMPGSSSLFDVSVGVLKLLSDLAIATPSIWDRITWSTDHVKQIQSAGMETRRHLIQALKEGAAGTLTLNDSVTNAEFVARKIYQDAGIEIDPAAESRIQDRVEEHVSIQMSLLQPSWWNARTMPAPDPSVKAYVALKVMQQGDSWKKFLHTPNCRSLIPGCRGTRQSTPFGPSDLPGDGKQLVEALVSLARAPSDPDEPRSQDRFQQGQLTVLRREAANVFVNQLLAGPDANKFERHLAPLIIHGEGQERLFAAAILEEAGFTETDTMFWVVGRLRDRAYDVLDSYDDEEEWLTRKPSRLWHAKMLARLTAIFSDPARFAHDEARQSAAQSVAQVAIQNIERSAYPSEFFELMAEISRMAPERDVFDGQRDYAQYVERLTQLSPSFAENLGKAQGRVQQRPSD